MVRNQLRMRFGFRVRWLAKLLYSKQRFFGLRELDKRFLRLIDESPSYYVEVGANDGVSQSNTLALELFHGWKGLLIEPVGTTFRELERNRSTRRNYLLRAACVSSSFPGNKVDLIYAGLMSTAVGLDSDVPDPAAHALLGESFLSTGDSLRIESVPAIAMSDALVLAGAPATIGLLSVDVEGAELEVLKGVNYNDHVFGWILVESRSVDRITGFLQQHGYSLHEQLSHHDYLFAHHSSLS